MTRLTGRVCAVRAAFFEVAAEGKRFRCTLRKKLKRERLPTRRLLHAGDLVEFTPLSEGEGVIDAVLPRTSDLARRDPSNPHRRQVIAANIEQVIAVAAASDPPVDTMALDRCTVMASAADLACVIVINKVELDRPRSEEVVRGYASIGFPTVLASARERLGLEELSSLIRGHLSVLVGPSGVGKSSLLNALAPGLDLKVGEVSERTREGRHTTSWIELLDVAGGAVADTPGLEFFTLWGVRARSLRDHFPEFSEFAAGCGFQDCAHDREPKCAVREKAATGVIPEWRWENYRTLLREFS